MVNNSFSLIMDFFVKQSTECVKIKGQAPDKAHNYTPSYTLIDKVFRPSRLAPCDASCGSPE